MLRCNTFLTIRQFCRMWINGWHDYWLNLIRKRKFIVVSQSGNAKKWLCCTKNRRTTAFSFPANGWCLTTVEVSCSGVSGPKIAWVLYWTGCAESTASTVTDIIPTKIFFEVTWRTSASEWHIDTTNTETPDISERLGEEMKNDLMRWVLRGRQHRSLLPSNFIPEATKYGRPSHFIFSDFVSGHVL